MTEDTRLSFAMGFVLMGIFTICLFGVSTLVGEVEHLIEIARSSWGIVAAWFSA